jgi:formamidopyrimidine-DNA glycosylase
MPELPDVQIYVERLRAFTVGHVLETVRFQSAFLVRTVEPPPSAAEGRVVDAVERIGKRLVIRFEGDLHFVLHLMIAGRLRWRKRGAGLPGRMGLAAFDFAHGTLVLTEASRQKRASLHVVQGAESVRAFDRGGLELLDCTAADLAERLRRENRTVKRALTSPSLVSAVGNAYSDEILHRARLSPLTLTQRLDDEAYERLWSSARAVLTEWTDRTRAEVGEGFPDKVTAFREQMAVHGRYRKPCPDCGSEVQRIVRGAHETNYCPTCQTDGQIYKDRALSRLLGKDWPRTLEEWEDRRNPDGA